MKINFLILSRTNFVALCVIGVLLNILITKFACPNGIVLKDGYEYVSINIVEADEENKTITDVKGKTYSVFGNFVDANSVATIKKLGNMDPNFASLCVKMSDTMIAVENTNPFLFTPETLVPTICLYIFDFIWAIFFIIFFVNYMADLLKRESKINGIKIFNVLIISSIFLIVVFKFFKSVFF